MTRVSRREGEYRKVHGCFRGCGARVAESAGLPCSNRTRETHVHYLITHPSWNYHLLKSIHSVHTTQSARIHPSIDDHSKNFVEPDSGAHTNTIKGVWALIKKKLRCMCGTLYEYILSYLDEFTWFRNFGRQLLEDITKQFPVQ